MGNFTGFLVFVAVFALQTIDATGSNAEKCNSRFYCKTKNARYMSMNEATGVYLNTTAINTIVTKDIPNCQTSCIRTNGCYSININIKKANKYICYLLTKNIYTYSKLLVRHKDFIHLFIENPCKNRPCKNNGVCYPNYASDNYSCQCHQVNTTTNIIGQQCEIVKPARVLLLQYVLLYSYFNFYVDASDLSQRHLISFSSPSQLQRPTHSYNYTAISVCTHAQYVKDKNMNNGDEFFPTGGFESGDYYWSFDKIQDGNYWEASGKSVTVNSTIKLMARNSQLMRMPGRRPPVAYTRSLNESKFHIESTKDIPCLTTFEGCESFTYSAWVKISKREIGHDNGRGIFSFRLCTGQTATKHFIVLTVKKNGFNLEIIINTKEYKIKNFATNAMKMNWNHFVITFTSSTLCVYVNGKYEANQCTSSYETAPGHLCKTYAFTIGNTNWQMVSSKYTTEMYIDELAIWKTALNASEVNDVYKRGKV
eukprot:gene16575-18260_t